MTGNFLVEIRIEISLVWRRELKVMFFSSYKKMEVTMFRLTGSHNWFFFCYETFNLVYLNFRIKLTMVIFLFVFLLEKYKKKQSLHQVNHSVIEKNWIFEISKCIFTELLDAANFNRYNFLFISLFRSIYIQKQQLYISCM